MAGKQGKDLALSMLRVLPRLSIGNIRDNPGSRKSPVRYNQNITRKIQWASFFIYRLINRIMRIMQLLWNKFAQSGIDQLMN